MRIVEISVLLVAVAFALLATYLVPVLIQLRKAVTMSEQLLAILKRDVPQLLRELRALSHQVNDLTQQVRGGVEHAVVLLHAVGEVGSLVKHVLSNLVSDYLLAGRPSISSRAGDGTAGGPAKPSTGAPPKTPLNESDYSPPPERFVH